MHHQEWAVNAYVNATNARVLAHFYMKTSLGFQENYQNLFPGNNWGDDVALQ